MKRDKPNHCPLAGTQDENWVRGMPKKGGVGSGAGRLPLGPVWGEDLLPVLPPDFHRAELPPQRGPPCLSKSCSHSSVLP